MQTAKIDRFAYIDALRGFAILGVVCVHSSQWVAPSTGLLSSMAAQGARGVQLFFVASALTLFLSMEARRGQEARPIVAFFVRRFFRIAPLFLLGIVAYLLQRGMGPSYWAPDGLRWWHVALTATFLHGWYPETINSVVPGGWSIAVEMTFYLCVPYLFTKLVDVRSTLLALLGALVLSHVASKLATIVLTPMYPGDRSYLVSSFTFLWFFSQLPVFLLGVLTFHVVRGNRRSDEVLSAALVVTSAFLGLAFLKVTTFRTLIPQHVLYGVVFVLFAAALRFHPHTIFVNRFTTLVGRYSFSIYITHFMVRDALKAVFANGFPLAGDFGFAAAFVLLLALSTGVSSLTHRFVEAPGIDLGKRVIAALRDRAEPETAGARA